MWKFAGVVNFICSECEEVESVDIDDFECQETGSDERGMGPEALYELTYDTSCDTCSNEIAIMFTVSEYPIGALNHVTPEVTGAAIEGEPYFEYLPDELYTIEQFDVTKATIAEIIKEIEWNRDILRAINPRQFEELIAEVLRKKGFEVELTARTRDGGKDIIAVSVDSLGSKLKYFIECKHYSADNKVGVEVVRALHGVKNTKNGPNKTIIATTSSFTADAQKFVTNEAASEWDIALADYDKIIEWLDDIRE